MYTTWKLDFQVWACFTRFSVTNSRISLISTPSVREEELISEISCCSVLLDRQPADSKAAKEGEWRSAVDQWCLLITCITFPSFGNICPNLTYNKFFSKPRQFLNTYYFINMLDLLSGTFAFSVFLAYTRSSSLLKKSSRVMVHLWHSKRISVHFNFHFSWWIWWVLYLFSPFHRFYSLFFLYWWIHVENRGKVVPAKSVLNKNFYWLMNRKETQQILIMIDRIRSASIVPHLQYELIYNKLK